ncbi:MAG: GLUG motif-containing protein [Acutalibacteraceae bacterium]|nr:GLUG motif-containing protein [Acutalibacteraceae bacterium]
MNAYFNGYTVGGVVCKNIGTITNCYNTGDVSGIDYTGGVVGYNNGTITNCYNTGKVSGCNDLVGGVAGYNNLGTITNCYNTGDVSGVSYIGGVAGYDDGTTTNCYNTCEVSGNYSVGGVAGSFYGTTQNCYYLSGRETDTSGGTTGKTYDAFANGEVAYLLGEAFGQAINEDEFPVFGGEKVYKILKCDNTYTYSNTNKSIVHDWDSYDGYCTSCSVKCTHDELKPEYTWYEPDYDYGDCYVEMWLNCAECNYYEYHSDYALVAEEVEATDCQHNGYEIYEATFEINGIEYITTKKFEIKSYNHTGEVVNGFCPACNGYEVPILNKDDVYEISNAGQLYWFEEMVNSTNNYACGVLTDDIVVNKDITAQNLRQWVPIGEDSLWPYCGTFDGQGYTISGLYTDNIDYAGLFGAIGWGATVTNLGVVNSYFEGNIYTGAVVGYNDDSNVTNCFAYNAKLVNRGNSTGDSAVGPVVGHGYGEISNCYYTANEETDSFDGTTFKTENQFKSGEVAYLLQGGIPEKDIYDDDWNYVKTIIPQVWGQNLDNGEVKNDYPTAKGAKVYTAINCIGEASCYSNTEGKNAVHVTLKNGFCTDCDGYEPAILNADGCYEIGNAGQLYWFAEYVNAGNISANAILTANIVVNEGTMKAETENARAWTPIGNSSKLYTGTFNGNNHTVSGLYFNNTETNFVGLFGCLDANGAVENTGVINSYLNGYEYVGGVVGYNNGTITNSYNTGDVSGSYNVGGVVGYNNNGTTTNCYNTGNVSGSGLYVGGMAGDNYGTITNCYNTGKASGNGLYVGGVAGNNCGTITNSYNTGEVSGSYFIGGVAGNNWGTITNCYYQSNSETDNLEDTTAKTDNQFASGEVAYLLQGKQTEQIWGQDIDNGKTVQEFPTFTGAKVYQVKNCKDETVYSNTDKNLDHKYENGSCTSCGAKESEKGVSVVGDINLTLEETDENIYTGIIELQAGTYKFNVDDNGTKLGMNYTYTDTATIDYSAGFKAQTTFKATGGRYTFTYNASKKLLKIKFKSFDDIVELFGDINVELVRNSADSTAFTGSARIDTGSYKFKINDQGTIMGFGYSFDDVVYNVAYNSAWSGATTFNATGGIYSVVYDTKTNKLTFKHAPKGLGDVRVFGDFNLPLANQGENIYSATKTLEVGTYQFRVDSLGTTVCNGSEFTNNMNGVEYKSEWKGATTFKVTAKQKFTFIFDANTNKIKILNSPIDTSKVLVAFENSNLELKSTDGVNYTATTTLDAGTYTFRMDEFGVTLGYGGTYTDTIPGAKYSSSYASATTFTATGGNYKFSYNVKTDVLKVTKA